MNEKPHFQFMNGFWIVTESKGYFLEGYVAGYTIEEAWGYWLSFQKLR